MIKGIGIDIIEVVRIKKAVEKNSRFLQRIFTENEIKYFEENSLQTVSIAGNFAAKEAVVKALGTGLRAFSWTEMEIQRNSLGKPSVVLYGRAKRVAETLGVHQMLITISHSKDYAVAQAIALENLQPIKGSVEIYENCK
ncbi:holo-ACP synthase [Geosporobacter ferrireducens]|uniref:Holo-[acyl-carrier-protein] synthase n=1 Tax=Geosporobacter ferrireducens TaxID=1424294 RepID=A0A1D8GLB7_9FIRM|nr:holo-ACP synthase [Geosporobacter ferrireducens]AOT71697.1 ACP synthase [Geosporobacter ferrireducens]MTI55471.1 holo-ACP synthase [Geosporobacter ferrireducens]